MTLHLVHPARCSNGGAPTGKCSHPKDLIVARTFRNGSTHWVRQCQTCGDPLGQWIKQSHLAPADMPRWNEELKRQRRDRGQLRLPL
jgi:hypothetical protein